MRRGRVRSTMIWRWRQEERWRKYLSPVKKLVGWLLVILFLNGVGWLLGTLMVSIR
jgi:hypothetical protein